MTDFTKIVVNAPPGRLGIHLSNRDDGGVGAFISAVNDDSPLVGQVYPGDEVVRIDEVDVSQAGVAGQLYHNCSLHNMSGVCLTLMVLDLITLSSLFLHQHRCGAYLAGEESKCIQDN